MNAPGICMITDYFFPEIGGVQVYTLELARGLRRAGLPVCIITRRIPGTAPREELDGIAVYRLGARAGAGKAEAALVFVVKALLLLRRLRRNFPIVHCHKVISPTTVGLLSRRLFGTRLLVQPHSTSVDGALANLMYHRGRLGRLRLAWIRRATQHFAVISRQVERDLQSIDIPPARISFIPNGVDTARFTPLDSAAKQEARHALGLPTGPLVVFCGRLTQVKNLPLLLRAWALTAARQPEATLVLLGDGEERAVLTALRAELGLEARVHFAGAQVDVRPWLQCADVFVLPSKSEAMPVALLEAMACGLACVASAVGGVLDIITPEHNGLLVEVGDLAGLDQAFARLLAEPALRDTLGRQARADIEQRYSLDAVAQRFVALYRAMLAPAGAG